MARVTLKWTVMEKRAKDRIWPFFRYDKVVDCFMLLVVSPSTQTVVHYIDEHFALLYTPKDKQIVGFQVEAFEKAFLPKHAKLNATWSLREHSAGHKIETAGDLFFRVDQIQPQIAREVLHASRASLGDKAKTMEQAFALA